MPYTYKEKHIVFEDIPWILNNPDFTDDEKLLLLIERGARHGVFVYKNEPKELRLYSSMEEAINNPD
jgi:hypothetical protein